MSPPEPGLIRIVAAVIRDEAGRVLLVRKRGARLFQQPGGKRDPVDADALATLARELNEELGCRMRRDNARWLGCFRAPAANEAGQTVEAAVYQVELQGDCRACAEIEELRWVDPAAPGQLPIAELSCALIFPQLV